MGANNRGYPWEKGLSMSLEEKNFVTMGHEEESAARMKCWLGDMSAERIVSLGDMKSGDKEGGTVYS